MEWSNTFNAFNYLDFFYTVYPPQNMNENAFSTKQSTIIIKVHVSMLPVTFTRYFTFHSWVGLSDVGYAFDLDSLSRNSYF